MQGDSVYYPDSTSLTAYFKVVGDTLYMGTTGYFIEKQSEHLLWFRNPSGEQMKLVKTEEEEQEEVFEEKHAQTLSVTEVVKRDTVVFYNGNRYHLYVAINPTKYKVQLPTVNEDGLDVENAYYDNIIHLSVFTGTTQLFSRDFRKQQYARRVPEHFLSQAVLSNMEYVRADHDGLHVNVSLCTPGNASCYLIEHIVSYQGVLSTKLLEY